jgi:hypothetical protein
LSIVERLHIPIVDQLPDKFVAVTRPIKIEDEDLIASIWFTLGCCAGVLATVSDGQIQFWRAKRAKRKHPSVEMSRGNVRTR